MENKSTENNVQETQISNNVQVENNINIEDKQVPKVSLLTHIKIAVQMFFSIFVLFLLWWAVSAFIFENAGGRISNWSSNSNSGEAAAWFTPIFILVSIGFLILTYLTCNYIINRSTKNKNLNS